MNIKLFKAIEELKNMKGSHQCRCAIHQYEPGGQFVFEQNIQCGY